MTYAAPNGHLDVVKYLNQRGAEGCDQFGFIRAAELGHSEVVKFLHEERNMKCCEISFKVACGKGFLEVAKYIHDNSRSGGFIDKIYCDTFENSCAEGWLPVVQFLHPLYRGKTIRYAFSSAARNDHTDVVAFLLNRRDECNKRRYIFDSLCGKGIVDIARMLLDAGFQCEPKPLSHAVDNDRLDIVRFPTENTTISSGTYLMDFAAERGRLEMLKYLSTHRSEGCCGESDFEGAS
ncbi:hypothetical protein HDU97_002758 [Phlyctochytrium planicorne]|nr:hypothetical protein HDU97_002758 [Phlyctochytrium planicorne]